MLVDERVRARAGDVGLEGLEVAQDNVLEARDRSVEMLEPRGAAEAPLAVEVLVDAERAEVVRGLLDVVRGVDPDAGSRNRALRSKSFALTRRTPFVVLRYSYRGRASSTK